jgi:predicted HicB family RNase H-like nuclease
MVTQGARRARGSADAYDEGQVSLHVRVRPDLRRRAREAAAKSGTPMRTLVEEALDAYLRRRGF